jgi:L-ribulose-5-phosphate 3-epimerase
MNRRQFFTTAAAAAAGAALTRGIADEPKKRRILKGIMYATVGGGDFEKASTLEKFQAIKEAGFDGVEAMSHHDRKEVAEAYEKTGLKCASVCGTHHWSKPLTHPSEKVRSEGLEALKYTLEDAHAWGGESILLVPGVCDKSIPYDVAIERAFTEISKAVPLAEKLKVRISIENVWNNMFLSPVEAAQFVDRFKSPWVGWHFDVGNIIHYGWPEQWVHVLGKRINRLHIKEYSRAKSDKEGKWAGFNVEFLKGDDNWPAVMAALDDIGYHGWGIAEQGGGNSLAGLKKLSSEMDQIFAS